MVIRKSCNSQREKTHTHKQPCENKKLSPPVSFFFLFFQSISYNVTYCTAPQCRNMASRLGANSLRAAPVAVTDLGLKLNLKLFCGRMLIGAGKRKSDLSFLPSYIPFCFSPSNSFGDSTCNYLAIAQPRCGDFAPNWPCSTKPLGALHLLAPFRKPYSKYPYIHNSVLISHAKYHALARISGTFFQEETLQAANGFYRSQTWMARHPQSAGMAG